RQVVHNVVGVAGEAVQGVDVVALHRREQLRRPVVRRAVRAIEPLALGVALFERDHRVGETPGAPPAPALPALDSSSTRSAASRPDSRTMGTPTPGTVDEPTKTTPGAFALTLFGRKGPVWKKLWAMAKGVPRSIPIRCQSVGSTKRSTTTSPVG